MVFGTSRSQENHRYGGGHLFRDLVEGKDVQVEAWSDRDDIVETTITLEGMPTARLTSSRHLFRNYRAFVNPSNKGVRSIFHCMPFPPDYGGLNFSGCGHFNPVQNDCNCVASASGHGFCSTAEKGPSSVQVPAVRPKVQT